jgi:hypothetical protein
MKNIGNWIGSVIAFLLVALSSVVGQTPTVTDQGGTVEVVTGNFPNRPSLHAPTVRTKPIYAKVLAFVGPIKSSPSYDQFLIDTVNRLNSGDLYTGIDTFTAGDVSAPKVAGLSEGRTIWFAVTFFSEEPFYPGRLRADIVSEPSNIFNKSESYYDSSTSKFIYASSSKGTLRNSNGVITYVNSGFWSDQQVNEFVFVGTASKTMDYSSQAQFDSNKAWLESFANFYLRATWSMYDEAGGVLATATKSLETRPSVVVQPPIMTIARSVNPGRVIVSASGLVGPATLLSSGNARFVNTWNEAVLTPTLPSVEVQTVSAPGTTNKFFRLVVQ